MSTNYSIEIERPENSRGHHVEAGPGIRRAGSRLRRNLLAIIREAELAHWQSTGGDFLGRAHRPRIFHGNSRGWQIGRFKWAAIVGLATALFATNPRINAEPATSEAPPVPVRRVTEQQLPLQFEFTGHASAAHQVEVRARVGGYVINAPFREGEQVTAGTLLFEIDPRPFIARQAQADAEVARAKAAVSLARQELARAERLAATDAIATEELERQRSEAETAAAALAAAIAAREAAALDVEFAKVKAPIVGRVSRALVKPGNLVSGGDANGTVLTTLVSVNPLHVLFNIDEPAYEQLTALRNAGRTLSADLRLGSSDTVISGRLDYLAPSLDVRTGTAQARVVVDNANGQLAPGLFARVTVKAENDQPRLLVPESAIGAQQGSRYVLVVGKDNKLEQRNIVLGERRGSDRVVTDGLTTGESIVVNGLQRVRPGMIVQPVEATLASK